MIDIVRSIYKFGGVNKKKEDKLLGMSGPVITRQNKILLATKDKAMGSAEIAKLLDIRKNTVTADIASLIERGKMIDISLNRNARHVRAV